MTAAGWLKDIARQGMSRLFGLGSSCSPVGTLGRRPGARILCYHSIHEEPDNPYAVSTTTFREQMDFLSKHLAVVPLEELMTLLRRRTGTSGEPPIPPRMVAVTLDDGFSDAYTDAYPTLRALGIPATFFLPVAYVGTDGPRPAAPGLPQSRFLSWEQVREMSREGMAFGSHTLTHPHLTRLPVREARRELEDSRKVLEDQLGLPVRGLAYPYGTFRDFDARVEQLAAEAGYDWAVTIISGTNRQGADPLALRRTQIMRRDGLGGFKRALQGALDPWVILQRMGGWSDDPVTGSGSESLSA